MIRSLGLAAGILFASHIVASAQSSAQQATVQSLLNDGYRIAGVATSRVGGGLLHLQKGSTLMMCFVSETPRSTSVDTQYCKPVK